MKTWARKDILPSVCVSRRPTQTILNRMQSWRAGSALPLYGVGKTPPMGKLRRLGLSLCIFLTASFIRGGPQRPLQATDQGLCWGIAQSYGSACLSPGSILAQELWPRLVAGATACPQAHVALWQAEYVAPGPSPPCQQHRPEASGPMTSWTQFLCLR